MNKYAYVFQRNKKHECPCCHEKTFVRYVKTEEQSILHEDPTVGKCDRVSNCGYFNSPKKDTSIHRGKKIQGYEYQQIEPPQTHIGFYNKFTESNLKETNLFVFLSQKLKKISPETISLALKKYKIGTFENKTHINIMPCINPTGKVCTADVVTYCPNTGKTIKQISPTGEIRRIWLHKLLRLEGNYKQCFFGAHLIGEEKDICIVESPRTALLCSLIFPQYNWLASLGLGNFSRIDKEIFQSQPHKKIFVFPDKGGLDKTLVSLQKSNRFSQIFVFPHLEELSGEKNNFDIEDWLWKNKREAYDSINCFFSEQSNEKAFKIQASLALFEEKILNLPPVLSSNFRENTYTHDLPRTDTTSPKR
jgi:hypothetical protein